MKELPSHLVSEDFYIWFNIKEKEEYYSTPLYLYNVLRKDTDKENDEEKKRDETRVYLKLEKDISKTKLNRKKQLYITLLPEGIQNKFAFQQTFIRMYYLCFSLTDLIS